MTTEELIARAVKEYPFRPPRIGEAPDAYHEAVFEHLKSHDYSMAFEVATGRLREEWTPDDRELFRTFFCGEVSTLTTEKQRAISTDDNAWLEFLTYSLESVGTNPVDLLSLLMPYYTMRERLEETPPAVMLQHITLLMEALWNRLTPSQIRTIVARSAVGGGKPFGGPSAH